MFALGLCIKKKKIVQLFCPIGISHIGNLGGFPWRKPAVKELHSKTFGACAGCFSVSIICPPLTWTVGSLTCAQILTMHAIAYGGVWTHVRESALKVTLGEKSLATWGIGE